jgi:hypothetical protein
MGSRAGMDAAKKGKTLASAGNRTHSPRSYSELPWSLYVSVCTDCTGFKFYCDCLVLYRNKLVFVFYLIVASQDTNSGSPSQLVRSADLLISYTR